MKRIWLVAAVLSGCLGIAGSAASTSSDWEKPASELADQIAAILGPGQARLTLRNLSTISADQVPVIRKLLEQDLKTHGVLASGAESANAIEVTLSENLRERLWVAEVMEGSETRVAMEHVDLDRLPQKQAPGGLMLRSQEIFSAREPVLATLDTANGLVVLGPEQIVISTRGGDGWRELKRASIGQKHPLPRDPRGILQSSPNGQGFDAWLAGTACSGTFTPAADEGGWAIHCRESDDFWPIVMSTDSAGQTNSLKAFYNASRNSFTGVVNPSSAVELPAFYSAALLPRAAGGAALLVSGVDGKVQLEEGGALRPVSGTRDWGSDVAELNSGCGAGAQVIASGSGEAPSDSLRAYELPAQEAVPAGAPLAVDGTVMALWSTADGKSVLAVVRHASGDYEVDRVTALCN